MNKDSILKQVAYKLYLTDSQIERAHTLYENLSDWLDNQDYPQTNSVQIFPQGSMRYGTFVRPLENEQSPSYDLDLVCLLDISNSELSPETVKKSVGDAIKNNKTYRELLKTEGKLCWKLQYAKEHDGTEFHIDVLAAAKDFSNSNRIMFTQKDGYKSYSWHKSSPEPFAKWFLAKCKSMKNYSDELIRFKESKYEEYKEKLDENSRRISASVQKCPDRYFRTTLQQLVQLMKRSRDVYFCDKDNNRNKPASIILTCIAANSYNGEQDLFLALQNVTRSIKEGAGINPITDNNEKKWEFLNPVDKEENYTRLWHENNNALYNAYNEWSKWFVENIERLSIDDNKEYYSVLKILFGEYPTSEILVEQGNNMRLLRESGSLKYGKNGFNTEEGEKVKNHNFYGK